MEAWLESCVEALAQVKPLVSRGQCGMATNSLRLCLAAEPTPVAAADMGRVVQTKLDILRALFLIQDRVHDYSEVLRTCFEIERLCHGDSVAKFFHSKANMRLGNLHHAASEFRAILSSHDDENSPTTMFVPTLLERCEVLMTEEAQAVTIQAAALPDPAQAAQGLETQDAQCSKAQGRVDGQKKAAGWSWRHVTLAGLVAAGLGVVGYGVYRRLTQ